VEFVIVLTQTDNRGAVIQNNRLLEKLRDLIIVIDEIEIKIAATFGIAEINETTFTLESLVAQADKALYEGKDKGGNRLAVFGE
jgi:diguanylate cyclase (GGDEF)-like protein